MKRTLLQVISACFFITSLTAQTDKCHTDQLVNKKYQNDPKYALLYDQWRNSIVQIAQQNQIGQHRGTLYTIPIVFHVILSSQVQVNGITDNEIQQQVATMNKDFRKQNADTSGIRSTFKPLASDIEIEFCLAARDPNGNSTNGITRTVTAHGPWDDNTEGDDMKSSTTGGVNAWQPTKYINVWIVDIAGSPNGGTAGYAYIGGNGTDGSAVDGIVLDFQLGFGPTNRSLTHEMGHYFGLFHTWGTANSCSNDDGIDDTPESFTANFDCTPYPNTCPTGENPDLPDQVENYMDYSDCPAMFTIKQKTVMRTVLTGSRSSLLTSTGCQSVNAPPFADFYTSTPTVCTGSSVTFTDNSTNGATSWSWSFPGGTPNTSTQQNPSVTYSTAGTYNVVLTATNAFGSDSETKTGYITVGSGISTTIFSENFEGSIAGWGAVNPDNGLTWEVGTGLAGSPPGDAAARVHLWDYQTRGERDGLVSPAINLSGKTQVSLTFEYAHRRYTATRRDSLIVYVSTNGGSSFTRVYANAENGQGSFATGSITTADFVPAAATDWCTGATTGVTCPVIDLSAYNGQSNFRIKFETYNDWGNNIYIDNIALTGLCNATVLQPPVAAFTANKTSGCNAVSVNFTDQSTNTPTSWSWQFTGGSPSTSTQKNPTVTYSTPGTYSVVLTATNADGSDGETKTNYITVFSNPTPSATPTNASCPGVTNGSVTLSVSGNAPYTYIWSTGATTQNISNVAGGSYGVTVTDNNNCSATNSTTVGTGTGPTATLSKVDADCPGVNTGSINLSINGGTGPFSYSWSNGATTQNLNNIAGGPYSVTVTDNGSCTATNSTTVGTGAAPSTTASTIDASCSGVDNGAVNLSVSGGTSPYDYEWSNGATTQNISGIASGTYLVTVTDVVGCTAEQSAIVGKGSSLQLAVTIDHDSMNTGTGSIVVAVSEGTLPYTYEWSNGDSSNSNAGLHAGSYSLTVTDANGCETEGTYTVANDTGTAISVPTLDLFYSIYPNPTDGALNLRVNMLTPDQIKLTLYNAIGQRVLEQSYSNTLEINAVLDVSTLEDGIYFLRMENNSKVAVSRVVVMRGKE